MLTRPTQQQLKGLLTVTNGAGWTDVRQMLEQELDETVNRLTAAETLAAVHRAQGRVALLKEILETAAQARELLEKTGHSAL